MRKIKCKLRKYSEFKSRTVDSLLWRECYRPHSRTRKTVEKTELKSTKENKNLKKECSAKNGKKADEENESYKESNKKIKEVTKEKEIVNKNKELTKTNSVLKANFSKRK